MWMTCVDNRDMEDLLTEGARYFVTPCACRTVRVGRRLLVAAERFTIQPWAWA
jgi:hypothetical protein